jgi:O-antigen/teichoic acid export membrane protein
MRIERRILLNTAMLGVGEVVGQLANFAFVVLFARRFGVEIFGWYSFAMALGASLAPFVSLGGVTYVTRELAREPACAGALFGALRPVQLASGIGVWLAMALIAVASGVDSREMHVIVIVGAYHVLMRMTALYLLPSVARQQLLGTAVVGGGHRVLVALLASVALLLGAGASVALLAMPVAAMLSLIAAWAYARGDIAVSSSSHESIDRIELLRASLPFLGTAVLAAVYTRGGLLLLTGLRGDMATGLYSVADRLLVPIYMVTGTFVAAVFPALARLSAEPARMRELGRRCVRLIMLATIPLATLLAIFAADVTTILFGKQAISAAPVLAMLAPLAVARSVSSLWLAHCAAVGAESRAAIAKGRAVLYSFVLAGLGIIAFGPTGLALATVLTEFYLAWCLRRILIDYGQYESAWRTLRSVFLAAAAAAVVAALVRAHGPALRAALVVCTIVIVTVMFEGIRGHDLRFLMAILRDRDERSAPTRHHDGTSDR